MITHLVWQVHLQRSWNNCWACRQASSLSESMHPPGVANGRCLGEGLRWGEVWHQKLLSRDKVKVLSSHANAFSHLWILNLNVRELHLYHRNQRTVPGLCQLYTNNSLFRANTVQLKISKSFHHAQCLKHQFPDGRVNTAPGNILYTNAICVE